MANVSVLGSKACQHTKSFSLLDKSDGRETNGTKKMAGEWLAALSATYTPTLLPLWRETLGSTYCCFYHSYRLSHKPKHWPQKHCWAQENICVQERTDLELSHFLLCFAVHVCEASFSLFFGPYGCIRFTLIVNVSCQPALIRKHEKLLYYYKYYSSRLYWQCHFIHLV